MAAIKTYFSRLCPCRSNGKSKGPKSINIFLGFFFIVNYCLGTGFLGVPYSFFYAGYLAGVPTLLVIAFVSWNTACWEVECMARAQAIELYRKSKKPGTESDTTDSEKDEKGITTSFITDGGTKHPQFIITLKRKFEPSEMCEVFFNRWMKYLYIVIMTIYCFLAMWSFSTVAGSAWAVNIPFHFTGLNKCLDDAFLHQVIPINSNPGCLGAYYFSLLMFAVIVISLSLIDLKEQAIVQMFLGFLRFLTVGAIIVYCIVKLAEGGEICEPEPHQLNLTTNATQEYIPLFQNATRYISMRDIVVKFDPRGWVTAIPVFTYAFIIHQGIPSLTHPIKQKQYLRWLMVMMFAVSLVCYMSLGVVVPLWFKARIQETCTLNWAELARPGNSPQLRALSYYLILFPSLDVASAYPLLVHTTSNNIYTTIMGRDTSKKAKNRYDAIFQILLRLVVAVLPIMAAFGVANLIYVLKYAGLIGFAICFLFPTALQLRSIFVCRNIFAGVGRDIVIVSDGDSKGDESDSVKREKSPLLSTQDEDAPKGRALYMTPYSSYLLSNPVSVGVIGTVGLLLFLLTISSLFIHPKKLTCEL